MAHVLEKKAKSQEAASISSRNDMRALMEKNSNAFKEAVKDFRDAHTLGAYTYSDD